MTEEKGHEELLIKTINNIRKIAEKHNLKMSEMALAYPLTKEGLNCVIAGAP